MDRRSFIRGAGLAAAGATLAAPAIAQQRIGLRLVMPWTLDFPGLGTGAQRFAERISAMSGGRYEIQIFAEGEFVAPLEEFAAVSDGRADLYHSADYYYAGVHPAYNFFTSVPLGMTTTEHNAWIDHGGGQELWNELSGRFNIKPLLVGNTGAQMGGWFKRPIGGLADLAGLNFRMPGLGGAVWRALGLNIVTLPGSQLLAALRDGTLDGVDWVGPWNDTAIGFPEVATNYYYPSLVEGCGAITLGINRAVWNAMPVGDQAMFQAACRAENDIMRADYHYNNARSLADLRSAGTVAIEQFPADVLARIAEVSPEVVRSAVTDDLGQRVHDSYFRSRDLMRGWSELSEGAYISARVGALD